MKQQIIKDTIGTLQFEYFEHGIPIDVTSALVTIYDEKGNEEVSSAVATVVGNVVSYEISASVVDEVAYNWKAKWAYIVDGVTKYKVQLFDIVLYVLDNPIIDDDIINRAPFVKDLNYRRIEQADSGTVNTVICSQLNEIDDYWNAGRIEIIDGINKGEKRLITDFDSSLNTLTVENDFTNAVDNTCKFLIIRSFEKEIDEAYKVFLSDLQNKKINRNRILDDDQIKEYIIVKTLELICFNFSIDPVDLWMEKSRMYREDYNKKMAKAVFELDSNDSGNIDRDEGFTGVGQVRGVR